MKPPPFAHQVEAATQLLPVLLQTRGVYLRHITGSGKTRTALALCHGLQLWGGAKRILVLCKVIGVGVWKEQIPLWAPDGLEFQVLTHDTAVSREKECKKWRADVVVIDEAQQIAGPSSKRQRAITRLALAAQYRILQSGTPVHDLLGWWSQGRILCPHEPLFQTPFSVYKARVAILGGPTSMWVTGFQPGAKEMVEQTIRPYCHDFTDLQCLPPVETVVHVLLGGEERSLYDQMQAECAADLENGEEVVGEIAFTKRLRLLQLANGIASVETGIRHDRAGHVHKVYEPRIIGSSKVDAVLSLLEEYPEERVVIACEFSPQIGQLRQGVRKRPCWVIDGGVSGAARTRAVAEWGRVPNGVLLLQYGAGGDSIDLTASQVLILASLGSSLIKYQQVLGRELRNNQSARVQILPVLAAGTVESALLEGLHAGLDDVGLGQMLADAIVRGGRHAD